MDDILIIGAGAAGLSAARILTNSGQTVRMLEAKSRIGGRIHTLHDPGFALPIELGAEFIHGRPREIWDIVDTCGFAAVEVPQNHLLAPKTRIKPGRDLMAEVESAFNAMRMERRRQVTLDSYIKTHRANKTIRCLDSVIRSYVENFHAADCSRIELYALLQNDDAQSDLDGDRTFRLVNGYGQIVDHLRDAPNSRHLKLELEAPVSRIEWSAGRVKAFVCLAGKDRTFTARRALVTLPLGVLKAKAGQLGSIQFSPSLPEKLGAIATLQMGHVVRIVFRFKSRFWEQLPPKRIGISHKALSEMSFLHGLGLPIPVWWTMRPLIAPCLTGWVGGPAAERLAKMPFKAIMAKACESLAVVFKVKVKSIAEKVIDTRYHNWSSDPFSRGAYSYAAVGGARAAKILAEPVSQTLFFAGEATEPTGQNATVHGAIKTGIRAAAQLLK